MNTTQRTGIMQRRQVVQQELMHELRSEVGLLTSKMEKVIHTLEWVRIESLLVRRGGDADGQILTGMLANAFVSKAALDCHLRHKQLIFCN